MGELTVDDVLRDFDRLLSLYLHVESGGSIFGGHVAGIGNPTVALSVAEALAGSGKSWLDGFKAGHTPYAGLATASFSERTVEVSLRHNYLQSLIFSALEVEFGCEHVTTELRSSSGGEIDFAILFGDTRILAELKVSSLARWCIRDAVGQLLEYGYFREFNSPSELWVLGVGACTQDDTAYLEVLRSKLGVPLFYRQFDEKTGMLGPKL